MRRVRARRIGRNVPHNVLAVAHVVSLRFLVAIVQNGDRGDEVEQLAAGQHPEILARVEPSVAVHPLQLQLLVWRRVVDRRMVDGRVEGAPQPADVQLDGILFGKQVDGTEFAGGARHVAVCRVEHSRSTFAARPLPDGRLARVVAHHDGRRNGGEAVSRARSTDRRAARQGRHDARSRIQEKRIDLGEFVSQLRKAAHFVARGCVHATRASHFQHLP